MTGPDRTEVLRRTDLAAVLDALTLRAQGGLRPRWRCPDPDHEDRHPSVSMRVVNGIGRWRCWSCGRGGTAIDALVVARRLTIGEAIRHLASQAHLEPLHHDDEPNEPVPLHPAVKSYAEACHRVLWTRAGASVLSWLTNHRGINIEVIRANRVGADPGPELLRRRSGLPRAGQAAVLPSLDLEGTVSYVQARYLDPAATTKYGNPVARLGTNPGLSWTHTPAPAAGPLVVCEGVIDGLTVAGAGLSSVAVLGATYPSQRIADEIAAGAGDRHVVVAFDGDDAGRIASERLRQLLADRGVDASICDLPDGADLNVLALREPGWLDSFLAVTA